MKNFVEKTGKVSRNVVCATLGATHTAAAAVVVAVEEAEVRVRKHDGLTREEVLTNRRSVSEKRLQSMMDKKSRLDAMMSKAKAKVTDNLPTVEVKKPKAWKGDAKTYDNAEPAVQTVEEPASCWTKENGVLIFKG